MANRFESSNLSSRTMIDKIGAVVIKDGKLLVVREKGMDVFFIPGGKREPGESDEEALRREMLEETNSQIESFSFYKEFITAAQTSTEKLKIRAYFCKLSKDPEPSEEIEEVLWVDKVQPNLGHALKVIIPELIKDGYL